DNHNHDNHNHDSHNHEHDNHGHDHAESDHHHGHGDDEHGNPDKAAHHHEHAPDSSAEKEITAVIVRFTSPMAAFHLPSQINESSSFIAALPAIEVNRLFTLFGMGAEAIKNIAWG